MTVRGSFAFDLAIDEALLHQLSKLLPTADPALVAQRCATTRSDAAVVASACQRRLLRLKEIVASQSKRPTTSDTQALRAAIKGAGQDEDLSADAARTFRALQRRYAYA